MKLIIDAGATKSEIAILSDDKVDKIILSGINPLTNPNSINEIDSIDISTPSAVSEIFYFGAGVRPNVNQLVESKLRSKFSGVLKIEIQSDLMAAALAHYKEERRIIAILGTGSNFALFEGPSLIQKIESPGYIWGDYGSGFAIGQRILESYFFDQMDSDDYNAFEKHCGLVKNEIIKWIYNDHKPNAKIASLSKFLNISSSTFKSKTLEYCFQKMITDRINLIENNSSYFIHFVGSIADVYNEALQMVCEKNGLKIGRIIKSPIDGLIKYYKENG